MFYNFLILSLLFFIRGQCNQNCMVPVVCTDDNGATVTSWRDMGVTSSSTAQPVTQSTRATTTTTVPGINLFRGNPELSDAEKIQLLSARVQQLSEPGWFYANSGYQYWISAPGASVSYPIAKTICQQMNSQIAAAGLRSNSSRSYIVENILKRYGRDIHGYWIGYTDTEVEDTFVWGDGGSLGEGEVADWANAQPDNYNNADCAVIARYFDYKWDDVPCESGTNGVLCERYIGEI